MADEIRFQDGAGYEKMMGTWSRLAGNVFLDWVAPAPGASWVDVGCGNGAFTELVVQRCAPSAVEGFDPSPAQIDYARNRPAAQLAHFQIGDAMAAPVADASFDVAVMALVIFFVPEPARGVAEMVRVVKPGGIVCAYAWDMLGGGFPLEPLRRAMRDVGVQPVDPPRAEASRIEAMQGLWTGAGLQDVHTREITVQREFADFEDLWTTAQLGSSIGARLRTLEPVLVQAIKERYYETTPPRADGSILCTARANAVKGVR